MLEQFPPNQVRLVPPIFWIGMISMVVPLLFMLAWSLYGLWGALQAFRGQDFRYALIGKLLTSR